MNIKKLERYLRINLLGPGPRLIKKKLQGRGLTKVGKHWISVLDLHLFVIKSPPGWHPRCRNMLVFNTGHEMYFIKCIRWLV